MYIHLYTYQMNATVSDAWNLGHSDIMYMYIETFQTDVQIYLKSVSI